MRRTLSIGCSLVCLAACSLHNHAARDEDGTQRLPRATDQARFRDPAADRGLVNGRAETLGAGGIGFDTWGLVSVGASVAPTRDLQLGFASILPWLPGIDASGFLEVKYVLARADRVVLSLRGQGQIARLSTQRELFGAVLGGVLADIYVDRRGLLGLHVGVSGGRLLGAITIDGQRYEPGQYLVAELGLALAIPDSPVKLVTDAWLPSATRAAVVRSVPFAVVAGGLRLFIWQLAVDVGALVAVGGTDSALDDGVPYLAIGGRL